MKYRPSVQVYCTKDAGWNERQSGEEICGFSPYQEVTCLVRAENSAGVSQENSAFSRTLCDGRNVSVGQSVSPCGSRSLCVTVGVFV